MKTHKYHPYGSCYVRKDKTLCYINIPKCASSSIKKAIHRSFDLSDKKKGIPAFAVIREPYSRYISGLLEYWSRTGRTLNESKSQSLGSWIKSFKKIEIQDEHTEKQISFLLPFITDIKWIITMENLKSLGQFGITLDQHLKKADDKDVATILNNLPFDKEAILEFYKEDEYLYNLTRGNEQGKI